MAESGSAVAVRGADPTEAWPGGGARGGRDPAGLGRARPAIIGPPLVRLVGLVVGMAVLALARAELALSGAVDAVVLGVVYGLAWLALAALAGWRPRLVYGHPQLAGRRPRRSVGLSSGVVLRSGVRLPGVVGLGVAVGLGVVGGLILVAISLVARAPGPLITAHAAPFVAWTAVTTLVAGAEEVVLRGVFFDAVAGSATRTFRRLARLARPVRPQRLDRLARLERLGPSGGRFAAALVAAIAAALAFALIHVPLEGWSIVPLDLGVGLWLAGLRLLTRGVAAPAAAHVVADLATWWL